MAVPAAGQADAPPAVAQAAPHHAGDDLVHCEEPRRRSASEQARSAQYHIIHDSALALVRGAARSAGVEPPAGLVSIMPGRGVRVYGGNVPEDVLTRVGGQLVDLGLAYQRLDPLLRDATLLVRLDPHPLPPCGRGPRRERSAMLRNRAEITRLLSAIADRLPPVPFDQELTLAIVLTRDSEVVSASFVDTRRAVFVNDEILDLVRQMRFRPKEIDGAAQDCLVLLPIRVPGR